MPKAEAIASVISPDPSGIEEMVALIRTAEKTMRVAMFTWTRLAEAERYTEAANRKRLAHATAERIEAKFPHLNPAPPPPGAGIVLDYTTKSKAEK